MLEPPAPQAIVLFGASGDLARRKFLPALYNLAAPIHEHPAGTWGPEEAERLIAPRHWHLNGAGR